MPAEIEEAVGSARSVTFDTGTSKALPVTDRIRLMTNRNVGSPERRKVPVGHTTFYINLIFLFGLINYFTENDALLKLTGT